jgi:ketosteroid isomerase-like protein
VVSEAEQIARRGWEAFNRRDFEAVLGLVDTDMEWRPAQGPGGVEGRTYRGLEAYREWLYKDLPEVWEEFHAEDLEFTDLGDGRVITSGYLTGKGRGSGAEIRVPFSQLGWVRDGKAVRIHAYLSREGAREAAGLN